MRRKKVDSDNTRSDLLESALDLFLSQGYQRTSLDQIAVRAKVTRGAAYWHFPQGKPELVNTLIAEKSRLVREKIVQQEQAAGSGWEKFCAYLLTWCEALENEKEFRRVTQLVVFKIEDAPELQEGMKQKKAAIKQSLLHLGALLERAKQDEEIPQSVDTATMALMAYSQMWGLSELWLMNMRAFSLRQSMQAFVELLRLGLIAKTKDNH